MAQRAWQRAAWKLAASLALLPGCELPADVTTVAQAARAPSAVIQPSAPAFQPMTLTIDGERSVGAVARSLGGTVDDLVRDNDLDAATLLRDGQELVVQTRPTLLAAYLEQRATTKRRNAERLAAKVAAAKAEAAARAAESVAKRRAARQAERDKRRAKHKAHR